MHGRKIKGMLQNMCLNLRYHGMDADFITSEKGVPYIRLLHKGERYHIVFFGKGGYFRVFHVISENTRTDYPDRDAVNEWALSLK